MGCGRCVVVNGIQENVDAIGEAGLAFYRNDADDLAGLLRELLANPGWVRQLGIAARARAQKLYDWDRITDQHEELFWSVIERRRGRVPRSPLDSMSDHGVSAPS
jgi:glycosyltransferase involved in cell wall biosynthesis